MYRGKLLVDQTDSKLRWLVCHTNPKCEQKAARGLAEKGFVTFLPTSRAWRIRHRQPVLLHRPLFTGYVFVGTSLTLISEIRQAQGVDGLLTNDGKPQEVSGDDIREVLDAWAAGAFDEHREEEHSLKPGDQVRVRRGHPFEGQLASVTAVPAAQRIFAMLRILGSRRPVEFKAKHLEAA